MWTIEDFEAKLGVRPLICVIHLLPLPGSPGYAGSMLHVIDAAIEDGRAAITGGADALIVENFGDRPFRPQQVDPETVSAMTAALVHLARECVLPMGLNVLRNDARAAIGIAAATGAAFIRVNIHTGAMLTDQGILEGKADVTLRERTRLGLDCGIFADHLVKHAAPIAQVNPVALVKDLRARGMADAIVVTGSATGEAADLEQVETVRQAVSAPVILGSGLTKENARRWGSFIDGAIVGTSIKRDGLISSPIDASRVRALADVFKSV